MTKDVNLYGTKAAKLPTPKFIIFYNGEDEQPDSRMLKLSDSFTVQDAEYALELKAIMLNINPGHNTRLMDACKTLRDYSEYTSRVRQYAKTMTLAEAVDKAIKECIDNDILAEFLSRNRAEARTVSIYEYDEEKHMRQVKAEGEDRFAVLTERLLADSRTEDLQKAVKDKAFRADLYKEYGIQ